MMPPIKNCPAYLLIRGDNLAPLEISKLLGSAPTFSAAKGDELVNEDTGKKYKADTGRWILTAPDPDCGRLDRQIDEILVQLTSDLTIWRTLGTSHTMVLFCGLFMDNPRQSLNISAPPLAALAERGIGFEFNIFTPMRSA